MSERKQVVLVQPKHDVWDQLFVRLPESVLSVADKPICVGVTSLTGPSPDTGLLR